MDRLAKKCVITSGIVHGTLVLLLIVGPAFLSSDNTPSSSEILTIIPDLASPDGAAVMGFGTPNGGRQNPTPPTPPPPTPKPPAPAPPAPAPAPPQVERVKETPKPEPIKQVEKEAKTPEPKEKSDPDAVEPAKPRRPVINLTQVTRKSTTSSSKEAERAAAAAETARINAENQRRAAVLRSALNTISSGASSGVEVGPIGVATGSGPSVAAYGDILRTIYFNNWHEPSDATSDDGIVKVTVTIARDGTVISGRITKSSGDAAVDRSVQRTLDNVTFIKAFPPSWKEAQRQFQLSFSLKAKRSLG